MKKEFLDKLLKETNNKQLVHDYEDFIDGRISEGESEEDIIASYNVKHIARLNELEQRKNKDTNNNKRFNKYDDATTPTQNVNINVKVNSNEQDDRKTEHVFKETKNNTTQTKKQHNKITFLILSIFSFIIMVTSLVLIGVFASEIVEEVIGQHHYDWDEIIGYSIGVGLSIIAFIIFLTLGIVFTKKQKNGNIN